MGGGKEGDGLLVDTGAMHSCWRGSGNRIVRGGDGAVVENGSVLGAGLGKVVEEDGVGGRDEGGWDGGVGQGGEGKRLGDGEKEGGKKGEKGRGGIVRGLVARWYGGG